MALAGVMCGADGLILEMHETPEKAFSDGQQTLDFNEFEQMIAKARRAFELHKNFWLPPMYIQKLSYFYTSWNSKYTRSFNI